MGNGKQIGSKHYLKNLLRWSYTNIPYIFLGIILFISILFRFLNLSKLLVADEMFWVSMPINNLVGYHPPFAFFIFGLFYKILRLLGFGYYRALPLFFTLINLIILYFIVKKAYNKKSAFFSVGLLILSFWNSFASSLIDPDNTILVTLWLLSLYFFIEYERNRNIKPLFFCAIAIAFAFITKFSTIAFLVGITLYKIYKGIKKGKTFLLLKEIVILWLPLILLFALYYFISALFYPAAIETAFGHGNSNLRFSLILRPFLFLILWATPLLLFIFLFSFIFNREKRDVIFIFIFAAIFLFYSFIAGPTYGPYERYQIPLQYIMAIICGKTISKMISLKDLSYKRIALFLFFLFLFIFLNNDKINVYLTHDYNNYFHNLLSLNWNFNFPFLGSSGPEFWFSFLGIITNLLISSILFSFLIIRLIKKQKKK